MDLSAQVRAARSAADREAGEARAIGSAGQQAVARAAALRGQIELHGTVVALLNRIGEERQDTAQRQIEELVTRGLQVVFDNSVSFHLIPRVVAGRATLDPVIRTVFEDGELDTHVLEARGGGMAAVTGFLLRVVVLLLTPETQARRFLALDETFGMVSAEYEPRVAEFLRELADKAGVQILLITHSTAYSDAADVAYRLILGPDGTTQVAS
jgi:hypothetical protein